MARPAVKFCKNKGRTPRHSLTFFMAMRGKKQASKI